MWFVMHATCLARVVERGEMVPHLGPVGTSLHYTPLSNGDRLVSLVESIVSWRPQRVEGGPAVPRENHGKKIGKNHGKGNGPAGCAVQHRRIVVSHQTLASWRYGRAHQTFASMVACPCTECVMRRPCLPALKHVVPVSGMRPISMRLITWGARRSGYEKPRHKAVLWGANIDFR